MEFNEYCADAGFDPATLTDKQKTTLQAAWRAAELKTVRDSRNGAPLPYADASGTPDSAAIIEAGLLVHLGVSPKAVAGFYGERVVDAASDRRHRVGGIQQVLKSCLAAAGKHVPPGKLGTGDIAEAFRAQPMAAVGVSTGVQLSGILGNTANKSLLAAFMNVPTTYSRWAKKSSCADFKQATRYRMTGDGAFEQIAPAGEIKHVGLSESSSTAALKTYGAMLGISREDIVNDDLGAFAAAPTVLSRLAALKVEKVAVTALLENTGGTSTGYFSTANGNYDDGATDSVLSLAGLDNAYAMMTTQTDSNGDPIMVPPALLLVPPALEMTARSLMTSTDLTGVSTANSPGGNPWFGRFEVVVVPHLATAFGITNASNTAWYLALPPGDYSAMEVNFLGGREVPFVETADFDFDRLGIAMRAYHDFSANTLEYRGAVLLKGAA